MEAQNTVIDQKSPEFLHEMDMYTASMELEFDTFCIEKGRPYLDPEERAQLQMIAANLICNVSYLCQTDEQYFNTMTSPIF